MKKKKIIIVIFLIISIIIFAIILLENLIIRSYSKVFSESMDTYIAQLKGDIYLDKTANSILLMKKTSEDSFIVKGVIVDKIDSIYVSKDKSIIYVINDINECILVKPDFKTERLSQKPKVDFVSIINYHE